MSDPFREHLLAVLDIGADQPAAERLMVLSVAWGLIAARARADVLVEPGGFPAERDRQLDILAGMAELVTNAEPDLEAERLLQERDIEGRPDIEGILRHLRDHSEG